MNAFTSGRRARLRRGLAVIFLALLAAPGAALAVQGVGLIMPIGYDLGAETQERFSRALQQAGIPPGDVEILPQRPGFDRVSILNSVRKVVAYDARVLVVFGGTAAREAAQEARNIPAVFVAAYDPVAGGVIPAPDKPGKNITGVYCKTSLPTLLEAIQESVSEMKILGVAWHSDSLDAQAQVAELKELAAKRGFRLVFADLKGSTPDAAVATLQAAPFVYLAAGVWPELLPFASLERLNRPLATQAPNAAGARPVFSLAGDGDEMLAEAARLTARVLKGEKASQVPVSGVKKIAFTVDLLTAQKLGIKVPFTVLGRATKILK